MLAKLQEMSLLFQTSILFIGAMSCLILTRFKPGKYLKYLILGRHRMQRILENTKNGEPNGEIIVDIYKEIKQSTKLNITQEHLEEGAEEVPENDTFAERTARKRLDRKQNRHERTWYLKIIEIKDIQDEKHKKVVKRALVVISDVLGLQKQLIDIRKQEFEKDNKEFCDKLMKIWKHFLPDKAYERYTNDWQLIGFQGSDPYTDLRAAGELFIDNFIYFIDNYPNKSKKWLATANDENNFFFFAVTGIHSTMWGIDLLDHVHFLKFMMCECYQFDAFTVYQETVSRMLIQFTDLWSSKQRDIMDFNTVSEEYIENIKQNHARELKNEVVFRLTERKKKQ